MKRRTAVDEADSPDDAPPVIDTDDAQQKEEHEELHSLLSSFYYALLVQKVTFHAEEARIDVSRFEDDGLLALPEEQTGMMVIQSRYCETATECIDACFSDFEVSSAESVPLEEEEEEGEAIPRAQAGRRKQSTKKEKPRYIFSPTSDIVEVPADLYDDAVKAMQRRIRRGHVAGVDDAAFAENLIAQGRFTHNQAYLAAKDRKIESLRVYGKMVSCSLPIGLSSTLAFVCSVRSGKSVGNAIVTALAAVIATGGPRVVLSALRGVAKHAAKDPIVRKAVARVTQAAAVRLLGYQGAAAIVNAVRGLRGQAAVSGAVAMKSFTNLLSTSGVIAAIDVAFNAVFVGVDLVRFFKHKMSGVQVARNAAVGVAGSVGAAAGGAAGAALGSLIFPGIGTLLGGLFGGIVGAFSSAKASDGGISLFANSDKYVLAKFRKLFLEPVKTELLEDYLIMKKELTTLEEMMKRAMKDISPRRLRKNYTSFRRRFKKPKVAREYAVEVLLVTFDSVAQLRDVIREEQLLEMIEAEVSSSEMPEDIKMKRRRRRKRKRKRRPIRPLPGLPGA